MTTLTIFSNKTQTELLLGGKSSIPLPESVMTDSITCINESGKSLAFRVLSKHNLLQVEAEENVIVTFLFTTLTWKCLGRLYIDEDLLSLHLLGQITNTEEKSFAGNVGLVTGKQNEIPHIAARSSMAKLASEASFMTPKASPNGETLEDYYQYSVGDLTLEGNSMTVYPLSTYSFPYAKVYLVSTGHNQVNYGYRLFIKNMYIPDCELSIYKDNLYLGSTSFQEAREGDERLVLTGISTQVRCNNLIQTHQEEEQDIIDENTIKTYTSEAVTCELFNRDKVDATVLIKHPLNNRNVEGISPKPAKIEDDLIQWEVKLAPGEKVFEAVIVYYEIIIIESK